jgi:hypothetical protein
VIVIMELVYYLIVITVARQVGRLRPPAIDPETFRSERLRHLSGGLCILRLNRLGSHRRSNDPALAKALAKLESSVESLGQAIQLDEMMGAGFMRKSAKRYKRLWEYVERVMVFDDF